jgi:hypothetical protein
LFFLATAGISAAIALHATIKPAATIMLTIIDFMLSPVVIFKKEGSMPSSRIVNKPVDFKQPIKRHELL